MSEPECSGVAEQRHELATKVERHDLIGRANEVAADEHGGHGGAAAQHVGQRSLHVLPLGVLVQLVDGRVHTQLAEEPLDGVAHAAGAQAEDHHRPLRRQPPHPIHARNWKLVQMSARLQALLRE